jgi:hypothetical protein
LLPIVTFWVPFRHTVRIGNTTARKIFCPIFVSVAAIV